ncbi:MAG TPA: STAS domain-containing protein [Rhodopila sp.]|jgi:rsbT co-antagonist protein RsbR|nr:STAS domain-containing protein [Rhodopila sp.]
MAKPAASRLSTVLSESAADILTDWLNRLSASPDPRLPVSELERQCNAIVMRLAQACRDGSDVYAPSFAPLREILADLSRTRALAGFSPTETATFILSLKQPLFARLRAVLGADAERLATEMLVSSELVDALGLFMMESYQRAREEVIIRQQSEIAELSTPVVKLWQGILALPLIGTLDSARTQVVMENLLDSIVRYEADIAIIDITGVPTVDTLVAQHLLKTVAAARLMGADCIISGIRPQIAQTMVHLGVELNVISKANLSDAFALALRRVGKMVVNRRRTEPADAA